MASLKIEKKMLEHQKKIGKIISITSGPLNTLKAPTIKKSEFTHIKIQNAFSPTGVMNGKVNSHT